MPTRVGTNDECLVMGGHGSLLLVAHCLAKRVLVDDVDASLVAPLLKYAGRDERLEDEPAACQGVKISGQLE